MRKIRTGVTAAAIGALAVLSACKDANKPDSKEALATKPDVLQANLDTTMKPGENFYLFANGGWFAANPIPETESRWGIGNKVQDEIYDKLKKLCEEAANNTTSPKGSPTQMIGDLYASAMDSATIEAEGLKALKPELDQIDAIHDNSSLADMLALLHTLQVGPAFSMYVSQDEKNSELMSLHLMQGGLGLPNREYYLNKDSRTKGIRDEYVQYMQRTMEKLKAGGQQPGTMARNVMALETALAKNSRKLEDLRDPYANYNKRSVQELNKMTPSIKWEGFFARIGASLPDSVVVGQPEFFTGLEKLLKNTPIGQWKDYLKWQLVLTYADKLGGAYEQEFFHFYSTVLRGTQKPKPRWKRAIDFENDAVGELLGQAFVKEYFPADAKKRYNKVVDDVMAAYKERIQGLEWMSAATKAKALNKLSAISRKVGYPDTWKDYKGMDISRQPYARNAVNVNKWWFAWELNKLGKPVDRTEWGMNPQTYNAYYNPSNNEIVMPAAIFAVPGMKDNELDDAIVYGYAGASTIGHELTHGFDDEGRQYDEKGNLNNWWTKEDEEAFNKLAKRYVAQFDAYTVLDSMHVNGRATLGENIADLGGVVIGLEAFKKTEQYKKGEKIGGLTPLQRYFLGYSIGWMVQQRQERLANQILTDVHAPADLRVNGPFSNVPEFYEAFDIKPGDKLYRPDSTRVVIW